MQGKYILIVDDEPGVLNALKRSIHGRFGRSVHLALETNPLVALRRVALRDHDIVISDLRMPSMGGLELLRRIGELRPQAVRMVLTGAADFDVAQRAINEIGVFRYLCKPWDEKELARHVAEGFSHGEAMRRQHAQAQRWRDICATPTPQELERRRLELLEPGITQVNWGPLGEVLMPLASASLRPAR